MDEKKEDAKWWLIDSIHVSLGAVIKGVKKRWKKRERKKMNERTNERTNERKKGGRKKII